MYEFVGEPSEMSEEHLSALFETHGAIEEHHQRILDFLLYFGFLGIRIADDDPRYVYHYGYDMGIMHAVLRKNRERIRFVLNPAFWPALEVNAPDH